MTNFSAWVFVAGVLLLMLVSSGCASVEPLSDWHVQQSRKVT